MITEDFFVNGSLTSRSKVPNLLAAIWTAGRESILTDDHLDRTTKEAICAVLSDINDCPYCGDMLISLTVTEFNLLHMFLRHPRQVLERSQILNEVWGYDFYGDDNVLEIYVGYLRKKLEASGGPRVIQTVRGVGYVLREA